MANALRMGIGENPIVEMEGYPGVELVVNRRGRDLYVHLVNLTPGTCFGRSGELFFDEVAVHHGLVITVQPPRAPDEVSLLPSGKPLEVEFIGDGLRIVIPELRYHVAVRLSNALERSAS